MHYRQSRTAALAGTFTGPATEEDTIVFHSDGTTIVHGQGTCACTVDGASGTFSYRIESSGTFPTSVSGQYVGQGSGGLAGLHAEGVLLRKLRGRGLRGPGALRLTHPARL